MSLCVRELLEQFQSFPDNPGYWILLYPFMLNGYPRGCELRPYVSFLNCAHGHFVSLASKLKNKSVDRIFHVYQRTREAYCSH